MNLLLSRLLFLFSYLFFLPTYAQDLPNSFLEDKNDRLKLIFVGDIMGHGPQIETAEIIKNKSYDYIPCFQYVRPILQQADLAIGNLEVTLPGEPPYHGWPNFRSPDDLAKALRHASFDLLLTSNNHSNDAGKTGVINTIKTLESNGFYHTGTYQDAMEKRLYHPLIVYKKGFKLAFLNYTYGTDKKKHRPPTVVNLIDVNQIRKDLRIARRMKADAIIVVLHWGKEYKVEASVEQEKLASVLLQWGADIIIGSHPHVVQPIVEYPMRDKKGRRKTKLVSYSLGNFISNQQKKYTDGGIMLEIDLMKDPKSKQTIIADHRYIPVWRYIQRPSDNKPIFRCVPIAAFENNVALLPDFTPKDKTLMSDYAKFIRAHLGESDCPERKVTVEDIYPRKEMSTLFH